MATTDLARAWEKEELIRLTGRRLELATCLIACA